MNFLFLSRNKSHPLFLYHGHLCLDPQHETKALHLSIVNVNGEAPMDFRGIRIWAFANDQDMDLEGTILHSNYLDLFIFIILEDLVQSNSLEVTGAHLTASPL